MSDQPGGHLTPAIIASALDRLWVPPARPQNPFDDLRDYLNRPRNASPRTSARRYQDWTVRADGYRLVIEGGAIIGLAYDEDPYPWGDPCWLTSHLIADHEIRRITMQPHRCDDGCVCPRHGTPMYYWPFGDDHACRDVTCPFARGIRPMVGATLDFFPSSPA